MNEKHHQDGAGQDVEINVGEVDVTVTPEPAAGTKKTRRDLFLPISILVAAIVIGGAVVFAAVYHGGGAPSGANSGVPAQTGGTPTAGTAAAPSSTVNMAVMTLGPRDAILGNPSATVTIVEYGDYQCPYCGMFFDQTEPQIVQNYVNTGKVRMVFRDFPFLGPESTAAANAAQCAEDQNKLWPYHNALYAAKYADFTGGGKEDDGFFSRAEFLKLAQQVGLNMTKFTSCIDNNADASIVAQEKANAQAAGVDSTPTFFVNGQQIVGAQPYSVFQQAINSALSG
jgi:protein-disulfide isomerase